MEEEGGGTVPILSIGHSFQTLRMWELFYILLDASMGPVVALVLLLGLIVQTIREIRDSFGGFHDRIGKGINPARARALYDKLSKGERDAIADEATFVETEAWIKENKHD
jgi:hypothetical protein